MKNKQLTGKSGLYNGLKIYSAIKEDEHHISHVAEVDCSGMYSYGDYFTWISSSRLELIRGKIFSMSPAPSLIHQRWCGFLYVKLYAHFYGTKYEAFIAPFDVRICGLSNRDEDIFTVVQPDLCIVCDPQKLDERGCVGTPDVVIEVLSSGNNWRELIDKFKVYEDAGVKEYWVVHPLRKYFFIYQLDKKGRFKSSGDNILTEGMSSALLPDFKPDFGELLRNSC